VADVVRDVVIMDMSNPVPVWGENDTIRETRCVAMFYEMRLRMQMPTNRRQSGRIRNKLPGSRKEIPL